jgi:hypothetical protein
MPEINRVPFRYEPVGGDLLTDAFRSMFHTERFQDVQDTLQYLCFAFEVVRDIEGEIRFSDADDEPPTLRDLRYRDPGLRADVPPFPDDKVTLWP